MRQATKPDGRGRWIRPKPTIEHTRERFWSRVKKSDGCWEWQGGTISNGYGGFLLQGNKVTAHRAAFILENPNIAINGFDICHVCDNKICVRPGHLFVGTHQENMADMARKGRGTRGRKSGLAKLTDAQASIIRNDRRSQREIAADYGVSKTAINQIKSGKTYVSS